MKEMWGYRMVLIPPMVVWRFVRMECGPQCAVINSIKMMHVLPADSLDTTLKVHTIVQVASWRKIMLTLGVMWLCMFFAWHESCPLTFFYSCFTSFLFTYMYSHASIIHLVCQSPTPSAVHGHWKLNEHNNKEVVFNYLKVWIIAHLFRKGSTLINSNAHGNMKFFGI